MYAVTFPLSLLESAFSRDLEKAPPSPLPFSFLFLGPRTLCCPCNILSHKKRGTDVRKLFAEEWRIFFFLIGAFPLGPHSAVRKQRKTSQSAVSVEVGWLNTSDKHSGVLSGQLHCEGASKCISLLLTKTNVMYQYFFISIFNFIFFFKLFPVFYATR